MKIFSKDPKLGFLALIDSMEAKIAAGGSEAQLNEWGRIVFNNQVDVAVTAAFMIGVAVILSGCAWEWFGLLRGAKIVVLRESPYVPLPDVA